jgi:hypothetical protein
VLTSHKQDEIPLFTTSMDGIWAADRYSTAGAAARICRDDGHSAAGHGAWQQSEVDGALTRMVRVKGRSLIAGLRLRGAAGGLAQWVRWVMGC